MANAHMQAARKAPMDWTQLERELGKSRHALVRQLADMRRAHSVFTDVNGCDGLTWLDATAPESVTAFVRRNGRDTVLVVQNWTDKPVECVENAPTDTLETCQVPQ